MDRTLPGAATTGKKGPGGDGHEDVHRIPQILIITEASSSDCLVSYTGLSLGESYPSAQMQSVYSAAPIDWAKNLLEYTWCLQ